MKVIKQKNLISTDRDVKFEQGTSLRYLLASDKMGFSLHKTIIPKGNIGHWHYKNHLEACFCVSGEGILTCLDTGFKYEIQPDTCYVLDKNDNHTFESLTDVVLISVFNPPVDGTEIHISDGSYTDSKHFKDLVKKIVQSVNCSPNFYDAQELVKQILTYKI
jgi:L-ectoine synthase